MGAMVRATMESRITGAPVGGVDADAVAVAGEVRIEVEAEAAGQQRHRRQQSEKSESCAHMSHGRQAPDDQSLTVYEDSESGGAFLLDPSGGPKWKLVNSRHATIHYFPQCVHRVTLLKKRDDNAGCKLMKIEFKTGQSPLEEAQASIQLLTSQTRSCVV